MAFQFERRQSLVLMLACCSCLTFSGCASVPGIKPSKLAYATPRNPAVRCLCMWQQAEGPGLNGETTRGFSGQLFFFPREGAVPVAIQGDLKIYLFDDLGTDEDQSRPIHQVEVPNAELNAYLGETQFGPCYSVFVPYTRKGTHEANCALRVKLVRDDSGPLMSEITQVRLQGSARRKSKLDPDATSMTQASATNDDRRPTSSTIAVERDGKLQVTTQRLRYIGDATPDDSSLSTETDYEVERAARLRQFEARLRELRATQNQQ